MAERTGIAEIDHLIREFVRQPSVARLRDPRLATGECADIAAQFLRFVEATGAMPWLEFTKQSGTPEEFGYYDRLARGFALHTVNIVITADHQYMVDFTATQYGYREFPMVQRRASEGRWLRRWGT